MNFSSAMLYLRDGQCAKTPSMNGYVKRVDFSPSMTDPGADKFGKIAYGALHRSPDTDKATAVYYVVFVENPGHEDSEDADLNPQHAYCYQTGGNQAGWTYIGYRTASEVESGAEFHGGAATDAAGGMTLDAQLLRLMVSAQDWSTFPTDEVEAAAGSTTRW